MYHYVKLLSLKYLKLFLRSLFPQVNFGFKLLIIDELGYLAAEPGFEPGLRVPETRVLPLHHSAFQYDLV